MFELLWLGLVVVFEGTGYWGLGIEGLCVWVFTDARVFRDGRSPLYQASSYGHASCVEALILGKADVLQCNEWVFLSDESWLRFLGFVFLWLGSVVVLK